MSRVNGSQTTTQKETNSKLKMKKLIVLLACASLIGCAATDVVPSEKRQALELVEIGMSSAKVASLIGAPARHANKETANGMEQIWLYPEAAFMNARQVIGVGLINASGDYSAGHGVVRLTFANDRLSSKEMIGITL
jgi:hypothetical protein